MIKQQILEEIQNSKYFSILADETADLSKQEQFAMCLKYVHNFKIHLQFVEFVVVESKTGESLSGVILSKLQSWGLDL